MHGDDYKTGISEADIRPSGLPATRSSFVLREFAVSMSLVFHSSNYFLRITVTVKVTDSCFHGNLQP